jgi:hypothetical protein
MGRGGDGGGGRGKQGNLEFLGLVLRCVPFVDADVGRGREEEGAEPAATMGEEDTCTRVAELTAG